MQAFQKRLVEEQKAKQDTEGGIVNDEILRARQLARIQELKLNPGEEKFAYIAVSIQQAAFQGRQDSVQWFIETRRARPDDIDSKGYCAIHYAAECGHLHIIALLLKYGASVDTRGRGNVTALMCAAKGGHPDALRQLFFAGADLLAQDTSGMTAAHYASQEDHGNCIDMLYELSLENLHRILTKQAEEDEGSSLTKPTKTNNRRGSKNNNGGEIGLSEEQRHKLLTTDFSHLTPYTPKSVLIAPSNNGCTPLHTAASFDSTSAVSALLRYGIEVDPRDLLKETPMHKAARRSFYLTYELLQEHGGNETLKNAMRESPADVMVDRY